MVARGLLGVASWTIWESRAQALFRRVQDTLAIEGRIRATRGLAMLLRGESFEWLRSTIS